MKRRLVLLTALAATLMVGLAPVTSAANFPARIDLPDGFQPEGITTGAGNRIYVGSLADGAIWAGDARTGKGSVLAAGALGRMAVGLDYEDRSGRLWVAGGGTGMVHALDARTGTLLRSYTLPGASGFLNDVVVTGDAVYVTDSNIQQLVVIPLPADGSLPAAGAATLLPLTGDLSFSAGFNANGIVAGRGWLILVQSNEGKLFRVDPSSGTTLEIGLLGGADVSFGDGLELRGSTLWVVRNFVGRVAVLQLGPRFEKALLLGEVTSSGLDVPTTATLAAGRLWAVNSRFTTPPTPTTDYWITRLPTRP